MDTLLNIGQFVVASSLFTTAIVLIARHLIDGFFTRGAEEFKSKLEREAFKDRVRYEKLQGERAVIIKDVYRNLFNAEKDLSSLINPLQLAGEPTEPEKRKIAAQSANRFSDHYRENRLFFDEEIAERLDEFNKTLFKVWTNYQYRDVSNPGLGGVDKWSEAWNIMQQQIPELKRDIEKDFRGILGIGKD